MRKLYGRFLSIAVSSAMLFSFSAISIFADTPADISQDAVVTGSISSSANTFTETDTVSVDTSINRPVNSGDFVSYRFDNLAMGNLANRDITLRGTNTVIGKIMLQMQASTKQINRLLVQKTIKKVQFPEVVLVINSK